ncbi:cytidine deaminase-like protein [Entophlyctis helioformis]|nr:cytidine deaminase-like protein [Entophlyctis helioformis]
MKPWTVPQPVLSEEKTRGFEPVEMHTVAIQPHLAGKVLQHLSKQIPLGPLQHLKRTRRIDGTDPRLEILLSPVHAPTPSSEELVLMLEQLGVPEPASSMGSVSVSRHQAIMRWQYDDWKQHWPMTFHHASLEKHDRLSDTETANAATHMAHALRLARVAGSRGNECVGAVMVDPAVNAVVGVGHDARRTAHPLSHATMVCIEAVAQAERDRRAAQQGVQQQGQQQGQAQSELHQGLKRKSPDHPSPTADDSVQAAQDAAEGPAAQSGYLCSGLDLYLSREPCVMCAMALVHSRIRRVIYGEPVANGGALGSSYRVHVHPSLNHHYQVWSRFVPQDPEPAGEADGEAAEEADADAGTRPAAQTRG